MSSSAGSNRLAGRVAVVTGGASGIGEASVRRFLAEGARVVIADIERERGEALAAELGDGVIFQATDVAREADVAAAVQGAIDHFGHLDIMFNNAAIVGPLGPIADLSLEDFDRTVAVGLRSAVAGMKHAAAAMVPRRHGAILSTASIAAVRGYGPHAYTAAKTGLVGITRSVAAELWPHNIRVNALLPGHTITRMTTDDASMDRPVGAEEQRRARQMEPSELAGAALYLVSDEARFVTGEALVVDGGLTRAGRAMFAAP